METPFITWLNTFSIDTVWFGLKILYVLAFLVYVAFAVVVVSQARHMSNTLVGGFEKQISLLSWVHLALSVMAFVWAIIVL